MAGPVFFSVALCSCDGEQFLGEQLASLANQTYLPGEVVVCDDVSQDGTWKILENFKNIAPFPVRLYRNEYRLGIGKNFEQAIGFCSGEVIALCDQDDIWLPEKLYRFAGVFSNGVDAVCCNAQVTDAALAPLSYTLWDRVAFHAKERQIASTGRLLAVLQKHYVIAGATLAFRANLRDQVLPIPDTWLYDAWLAAMLAAGRRLVIIDECLQLYRQHQRNAVGGRRQPFFSQLHAGFNVVRTDYLRLELLRWQQLSNRLDDIHVANTSSQQVEGKTAHLMRRLQFQNNRLLRIPDVIAEVARGGYSRFSRNWGSVALDLFLR